MKELEIREIPNHEVYKLQALSNGEEVGILEYEDLGYGDGYWIHWLESYFFREGIATQLLQEMTQRVGKNVLIKAEIEHSETLKVLAAQGYLDQSKTGIEDVTDPTIINNLPLTKLAKAGGITITKLEVHYKFEENEEPVIVIEGRT